MGRATSLNYSIELEDGQIIEPSKIGEFSEGEEGRVDVADGNRKYKVNDQIYDIGEIEVDILVTRDLEEYTLMQSWVLDRTIQDVKILGIDAAGNVQISWLLSNCACAMGKKSEFDRDSKSIDKKKYYLLPDEVTYIPKVAPATVEEG